jgi:hypothetical protein
MKKNKKRNSEKEKVPNQKMTGRGWKPNGNDFVNEISFFSIIVFIARTP